MIDIFGAVVRVKIVVFFVGQRTVGLNGRHEGFVPQFDQSLHQTFDGPETANVQVHEGSKTPHRGRFRGPDRIVLSVIVGDKSAFRCFLGNEGIVLGRVRIQMGGIAVLQQVRFQDPILIMFRRPGNVFLPVLVVDDIVNAHVFAGTVIKVTLGKGFKQGQDDKGPHLVVGLRVGRDFRSQTLHGISQTALLVDGGIRQGPRKLAVLFP